jgi:hypothetical protein
MNGDTLAAEDASLCSSRSEAIQLDDKRVAQG